MKYLKTFEQFIVEKQSTMDFGSNELETILNKFKDLKGVKSNKKGLTYSYGTGSLTLDVKKDEIIAATFAEDRVHDFLVKMDELGFGPDIFGTLHSLSKKQSMKGYNTILEF